MLRFIGFAVAYAAAIWLGRVSVPAGSDLALFWPASGVGVWWAFTARTPRQLAAVAGAVFLIASVGNGLTGIAPGPVVLLGVANVVIALGTRVLALGSLVPTRAEREARGVHAFSFSVRLAAISEELSAVTRLRSVSDLVRFFGAAMVAAMLSCGVGMVAVVAMGGAVTWEGALGWTLRHGAAVVVIAGPALAARSTMRGLRRRTPELFALLAATALMQWGVFGPGQGLPLTFAPFALLMWSGSRAPLRVAGLHGSLVAGSTFALVVGLNGGSFGDITDPHGKAMTLGAFMLLSTALPMLLAAAIGERSRLTTALQHSELSTRTRADDLATITRTIPDGVLVLDTAGRYVEANAAAERVLALRPVVRGAASAGDPMLAELATIAATSTTGTLRGTDEQGQAVLVAVTAAPLFRPGAIAADRTLLVLHDVTEHHAQVAALDQARRRAERLFADAPHGVVQVDADGVVLQANAAAAALVSRSGERRDAEDLVGSRLGASISLEAEQQWTNHVAAARARYGAQLVTELTWGGLGDEQVHVAATSRLLDDGGSLDGGPATLLTHLVDVSEQHRHERALQHLADHDVLTGLVNRRRFERELEDHLARSERYGAKGALLLIDLDFFKDVNDTLGHAAGDQLLVAVAELLTARRRRSDVVARLGGDEFALLLPEADQNAAAAVASAVVAAIRAHAATLEGAGRRVTSSVGAVTFAAAQRRNADPLVLADLMMYDAKDAGRDGYALLDDRAGVAPQSGERLAQRTRLERAVDRGAFELRLEPVVDLRTGLLHHAEARVGLADGAEPAAYQSLHDLAVRAGLAPEIDTWALRSAIAALAELRRVNPELCVEVALARPSTSDPQVRTAVEDALRAHDVDPGTLMLSFTEATAVDDVETAREFAAWARDLGIQVALSELGAGFGSFHELKHLAFDHVRIHAALVSHAWRSEVDRTILHSIVGVARHLGTRTVAPAVSDVDTLEVCREEQISLAQGPILGAPATVDELLGRYPDLYPEQHVDQRPAKHVDQRLDAGRVLTQPV